MTSEREQQKIQNNRSLLLSISHHKGKATTMYSKQRIQAGKCHSYNTILSLCSVLFVVCNLPHATAFQHTVHPVLSLTHYQPQSYFERDALLHDNIRSLSSTKLGSRPPRFNEFSKFDSDRFRRPKRRGRTGIVSYFSSLFRGFSLQQWLVYFNVVFYVVQVLSAINYVPVLNSYLSRFGYRPIPTSRIIEQNIWGGAPVTLRLPTRRVNSYGPFTTDFYFVSGRMAQLQPHRYLTAGFLHGSVIHLLLNMQSLSRLPPLLENGLGWPLYLAAYLSSIVSGNIAHDIVSNGNGSPCLGASGGICGLNGLLFSTLRKMGRDKESNVVLNNMFTLVIYGLMSSRVSNAGHIGGFIAGALMGHLFSPQFRKSYVSKRSRWNIDPTPFQNSGLIKNGFTQTDSKIPISYFYILAAFAMLTKESLRSIGPAIVKGFLKPGSLGGVY